MPADLGDDDQVAASLSNRQDICARAIELPWPMVRHYRVLFRDARTPAPAQGVRHNAGKPRLDLIPAGTIAMVRNSAAIPAGGDADPLWWLGLYQMRLASTQALCSAARSLPGGPDWFACARVFEHGLTKYDPWNWARGMAWSAPIASAVRHLLAPDPVDPESGLPHSAHALCNLVMLLWYAEHYPEGDDRAPR